MSVNEQEIRELNLLGATVMGWHDEGYIDGDKWDTVFTNVGHGPEGSEWWFIRGLETTFTTLNRWNPCEDLNQAWEVFRKAVRNTDGIDLHEEVRICAVLGRAHMETAVMDDPKEVALHLMKAVQQAAFTVSLAHREDR